MCLNIDIICCLEVALDREVEGDLFLQDVGQGMGFRPGTFDGAIR
jgi:18S rRNA (guanine1575-N7)-methyltransferase